MNSVSEKKENYQFHERQLDIQLDNSNIVYACAMQHYTQHEYSWDRYVRTK